MVRDTESSPDTGAGAFLAVDVTVATRGIEWVDRRSAMAMVDRRRHRAHLPTLPALLRIWSLGRADE
jgi:hypothetical protein